MPYFFFIFFVLFLFFLVCFTLALAVTPPAFNGFFLLFYLAGWVARFATMFFCFFSFHFTLLLFLPLFSRKILLYVAQFPFFFLFFPISFYACLCGSVVRTQACILFQL